LRPSAKEYRINDRHDYKTNNLPNEVAVVSSKQDKLLNSQLFLAGSPRIFVRQDMVKLVPRSKTPAVQIHWQQAKVKQKQGHYPIDSDEGFT